MLRAYGTLRARRFLSFDSLADPGAQLLYHFLFLKLSLCHSQNENGVSRKAQFRLLTRVAIWPFVILPFLPSWTTWKAIGICTVAFERSDELAAASRSA